MPDEHTQELLRLLALDSEPLALYAALHLGEARGEAVDQVILERLGRAGPELAGALIERLEGAAPAPAWGELLGRLLREGSEATRVQALARLAPRLGEERDGLLAPFLGEARQDPHVLATLLAALAPGEGPLGAALAGEITPLLGHEDPRVRANAAELVAARGAEGAFPVLALLLEDPVPRVRAAAAKGAWHLDRDAVTQRVLTDLEASDPREVLAALHVLGCLEGFPDAGAILLRHALSSDSQVRLMALRSLEAFEAELDPAWLADRYLAEDSEACRKALAARARGACPGPFSGRLAAVLRADSDPRRRARAARGVGEAGGEAEGVLLAPFVTDADDRVRADVVESLGLIGGEAVEGVLVHALQDGAARVAANAGLALWRRGGDETLELLVGWLRGDDPGRAASAAFALGEIGSAQVMAPLLEVGERLRENGAEQAADRGLLKQIMKALGKVRGA